jgi:NADPH-dependent 2,4-dienoyl-CoA reductase/sulfur reductase-like enzyme
VHVVIVGASLAGLRSVESLRAAGFDGRVTMVGDELHEPYDRPPLSKEILTGKLEVPDIRLRDNAGMAALEVDLLLGARATHLDVEAREVELDGCRRLSYDEVVIATGSRARRLPSFDGLQGAHVLRTIEDAVAIRDAMETSESVAIVGGGFIGSEVASAARDRGLPTTVLEAMDAPLCRGLGATLGSRLGQLHSEAGAVLRCGVDIDGPVGERQIEGVRLADGGIIDADLVVVGVGSVPNTEWLDGSGLDVTNGVRCDGVGRAHGAEHVHAIGDVARWASERFGDDVRTEHWTSAGDQAQVVVAGLLGLPVPAEAVPYVWSDQFGHRIQVGGRCGPDDELRVVRDDDVFVAITGRGARLASVVAVDDPKRFGAFRRLIRRDATWDEALAEASR